MLLYLDTSPKTTRLGIKLSTTFQLYIAYQATPHGRPFDVIIQPVPVTLPTSSKVIRVAAGRSHTLALTEEGEIFSMGNNAYGQCGRNIIENEDYQRSNVIHKVKIDQMEQNDKVVDIICGIDHR